MNENNISRKEKRKQRKQELKIVNFQKTSLELREVKPITQNQKMAFDSYWSGKNIMLHGAAGTGKTFMSLYLALQSVILDHIFQKVLIVRSIVPTRDIGFLPGGTKEKMKVYESPYYSICSELFGRGDAYEILRNRGLIEFTSTSFVRGINLNDCVMIVDEIQNLTFHECDSIITRTGKNCRLIFSGDIRQSDLNKGKEFSGLSDFMKIIKKLKSFDFIEFGPNDICRSQLVKDYIITKNKLEDSGEI